jgi:uncharacterized membrane protein
LNPTLPAGADARLAGRAMVRWGRIHGFIRSKLTWSRLYRATSYLASALWTVPLVAIVLALLIAPLLRPLDAWLGWCLVGLGATGAQSLYQTVITLTLSFVVFTFGSLLVAIQVAGGQLTPRIIATILLRDNVVRYSVGLFVFTLVFSVSALNRVEQTAFEIVALLVGVLAIDPIHRPLRTLGKRQLRGEIIPDASGRPRVIFRTPNWEDHVHVACSEFRACGASNVQIARRLRAMLENLLQTLPERRHRVLRQELDVLDRTIATLYANPEDLALARIADPQGLGASEVDRALSPR